MNPKRTGKWVGVRYGDGFERHAVRMLHVDRQGRGVVRLEKSWRFVEKDPMSGFRDAYKVVSK